MPTFTTTLTACSECDDGVSRRVFTGRVEGETVSRVRPWACSHLKPQVEAALVAASHEEPAREPCDECSRVYGHDETCPGYTAQCFREAAEDVQRDRLLDHVIAGGAA